MADSCIVCLGGLATTESFFHNNSINHVYHNGNATTTKPEDSSLPQQDLPKQDPTVTNIVRSRRLSKSSAHPVPSLSSQLPSVAEEAQVIAHLLPCGHDLHDECLKPWVERANSCPICRTSFNVVELKRSVNGPSFSSYVVHDKQQVAELDPSMLLEEDDLFNDSYDEACTFCHESSDDDHLLICDGCNSYWHTYCACLPGVPAGDWYCQFCMGLGEAERFSTAMGRRPQSVTAQGSFVGGRTHAQQRASRRQFRRRGQPPRPSAWNQVWHSVWEGLRLDLDFPWVDEPDSTNQRTEAQQLEIAEWHTRFRIAERQGGAARFRETATSLLQRSSAPSPKPESQEELNAWNAFDKAKELGPDASTGNGRNKRKSVTASPVEPTPQLERKLKRPKTRRNEVLGVNHAEIGGLSRKPPSPVSTQSSRPRLPTLPIDTQGTGPSFFQSLLKEVESAPALTEWDEQQRSPLDYTEPTSPDRSLRGIPSPLSSPLAGYHNSPRARSTSPPPLRLSRPSSPPPLSSRIEPVFLRRSETRPPSAHNAILNDDSASPQSVPPSRTRLPDRPRQTSRSELVSNAGSPGRSIMSLNTKTEIQKLVSAALKSAYKKKEINTEQYTDINRDVSRLLYEIAAQSGDSAHGQNRERWRTIAAEEVEKSVSKLRAIEVPPAA